MPRRRTGTRTIAVVNGKGGSSKTPTTAMLAAVLAQRDQSSVLAWDNNEARGTLGRRTEQAPHEANVRDLLPEIDRLTAKGADPTEISRYVHPQGDGYDVLQSDPAILPGSDRLTGDDFDAIHRLVTGRYRVVVVDSGNAVDAPNWLRMLDSADQIVVPTTTRTEHAEAARLLLSALHSRDARSAALADQAVVIVSHAERDEAGPADVVGQYEWLARTAVTIPYDPAMRADHLRLGALAPATQQAWRRAADAVLAADVVPPARTGGGPATPVTGDAVDLADTGPDEDTLTAPRSQLAATAQPAPTAPPPPPRPPRPARRPSPASPAAPQQPTHQPTPAKPATPPAEPTPAPPSRGTPPSSAPTTSTTAPAGTAEPDTDETEAAEPAEPAAPRRTLDRRWLFAIIAAVAVVALALVACLGGRAVLSSSEETTSPAGPAPVDPVQGWSRTAEWASPALTKGGDAPVLVSGSTVLTTTSTDSGTELTALDAEDGHTLWSSPTEGELTGPPQLITRDDEPAVVAASANTLMVWSDLETDDPTPEPETWDFTEAEVTLVEDSPVPLLANEETLTALVLTGDELVKRTFPSETTPIAADDKGGVTAVRDSGHWYSMRHPTRVPEPTLLRPPGMGSQVREVLGTAGSTLVVSWSERGGRSRIIGYDMTAKMKPVWQSRVRGNPAAESFRAAPGGDWLIVHGMAIDARTGESQQLPHGWKTLGMTDERAWSREHVVAEDGRVEKLKTPVKDEAGVPVAETKDGLGLVVAAKDDKAPRIYALRPSD